MRRAAAWTLLAALGLAACATPEPSPTSIEPLDRSYSLACLSVPQLECETIASALVGRITEPGDVVAITVHAFSCDAVRCAPGFGARPNGEGVVELANPGRISVVGIRSAGGVLDFVGVPDVRATTIDPRTAPAGGQNLPFALGHCGLDSPIDADRSLWDPIGQIDGDASEVVNAASGTISFLAPRAARFLTDAGFRVDLVRRGGSKLYRLCA